MEVNARIKAVVFDLDGVYFENGTQNFVASLKDVYGLTQRQIEDVYFHSEEMKKLKRGEIACLRFWEFAVRKWEIEATPKELVGMMLSGYAVREETQLFVEKLRVRGIKTAVCTNNFSDRLEGLKQKFSLDKRFDEIVASYTIGISKPNPEIFRYLAGTLNLQPNEIIMSDDKESNVATLRELGFEAFLFESWKDFAERVNKLLGVHTGN